MRLEYSTTTRFNDLHRRSSRQRDDEARWIYIGESDDILAQLIQQLDGDHACLALFPNRTFSYELLPEITRGWQLEQLIERFRPICNRQLS